MRRWLAVFALSVSILCPAALLVSAQHRTAAQEKQTQYTAHITIK
jgi:hypothetical protein